jgi:hypothetical protein
VHALRMFSAVRNTVAVQQLASVTWFEQKLICTRNINRKSVQVGIVSLHLL